MRGTIQKPRFQQIVFLFAFFSPLAIGSRHTASAAVLFEDNFNDGDHAGWQHFDGSFAVIDGVYHVTSSGSCNDARAVNGNANWTDYALDVDFNYPSGSGSHLAILFRIAAIQPGCDQGQYYQFYVFTDGRVGFCKILGGPSCGPGVQTSYPVTPGEWHHVRIVIQGTEGTAYIDGNRVVSYGGFTEFPAGRIALKRINGGTNQYDNVVVSTLESGPGQIPPSVLLGRPSPTELTLTWASSECEGALDYGVYEGTLGAWYSHVMIDCHDDDANFSETITPSAGDTYYLIVPLGSAVEGSYGTSSGGGERPPGSSTCRSFQAVACP